MNQLLQVAPRQDPAGHGTEQRLQARRMSSSHPTAAAQLPSNQNPLLSAARGRCRCCACRRSPSDRAAPNRVTDWQRCLCLSPSKGEQQEMRESPVQFHHATCTATFWHQLVMARCQAGRPDAVRGSGGGAAAAAGDVCVGRGPQERDVALRGAGSTEPPAARRGDGAGTPRSSICRQSSRQ